MSPETKAIIRRRIEARIEYDPNGGCWLWTSSLSKGGYAHHALCHPTVWRGHRAHRLSYQAWVGPIPPDLVIDHKCRVRCCVNPAHLRAVTRATNVLENSVAPTAINKRKTHCKHGHPFSVENTWIRTGGTRECRICHRAQNSKAKRAKRLARRSGESHAS